MDVEFPNFNGIEPCSNNTTELPAEMVAFQASENNSRVETLTTEWSGNGGSYEKEAQVVEGTCYESIQDSIEDLFDNVGYLSEVVKEIPDIDTVRIVNNEIESKDIYSDSMTIREKMNWLEKRLQELKNIMGGDEVWMLSKEGHAMKVKCVLKTNELPEYRGNGREIAVKFLRRVRETFITSGVTQNDWVALASSRLKGDLKAAWLEEYNKSKSNSWAKFSDFVLRYNKQRFGRVNTDNKGMIKKRRLSCCQHMILKKKKPDII